MLTFALSSELETAAPVVQAPCAQASAPPVYARRLTSGLLLLGALLRLVQYFSQRSLWYDEALLALNILHRSWSGLTKPLDYNQGAPIGFLFLEKLSTQVLGKSELALRAIPLFAGVVALFVFRKVAERYLSSKAVPIGVGLFALGGPLIYYSSEAKQYSTDVLVSLLLLWLLCEPGMVISRFRLIQIALAGAIAIWFSHPASFVLAGTGMTWVGFVLAKRDWHSLRALVWLCAAWSLSFATCYVVSLRALSHSQILLNYWQGRFLESPLWSRAGFSWLVESSLVIFRTSAGLTPLLGAALLTAGAGALLLRSKWTVALLLAPAAVAVLASELHKYPPEGRFLLFFVPNLLLLVSEGTPWIADRTRRFSSVVGALLIVLLFAEPVFMAGQALLWPRYSDDIKPVILQMLGNERPGDAIYVHHAAGVQFLYYAELEHLSLDNVRIGHDCRENLDCFAADLNWTSNRSRVWVLFSHLIIPNGLDEERLILQRLETMGRRADLYKSTGARVYLYELHASSAATGGHTEQK